MKPHPTLTQLVRALTDFLQDNPEKANTEVVIWESAGMWEPVLDLSIDKFDRPAINAVAADCERK